MLERACTLPGQQRDTPAVCCLAQVDCAVTAHRQLLQESSRFFQQYDILLCPTVMLPPFDVSIP
jgi:Asp-tRNA(Asn)/Glu-tRNA(Gln) amidotransferase A subunit family amidase